MAESPSAGAPPSTAALVGRAQAGDRAAYARLITAVAERVRLYARLRLGPRLRAACDTEDVLQEAWLEAHRSLGSFRWQGEGSFTRWVNRIVEHRIRGLVDHQGAQKRRPPGRAVDVASGVAPAVPAAGPATAAAGNESSARLLAAMDALEDDARNVLLLRFHLGLTLDEAAHALGKSVGATRRLLGRALADLAERLEPRA
jgi:RNA polymerase sigma-70 factor (ECF subfamily)